MRVVFQRTTRRTRSTIGASIRASAAASTGGQSTTDQIVAPAEPPQELPQLAVQQQGHQIAALPPAGDEVDPERVVAADQILERQVAEQPVDKARLLRTPSLAAPRVEVDQQHPAAEAGGVGGKAGRERRAPFPGSGDVTSTIRGGPSPRRCMAASTERIAST